MNTVNEPFKLDGEQKQKQKQKRNIVKESAKTKPSGPANSESEAKAFARVTLSCSKGNEFYSNDLSDRNCGGGCV